MKKRNQLLAVAMSLTFVLSACGGNEQKTPEVVDINPVDSTVVVTPSTGETQPAPETTEAPVEEVVEEDVLPEGMVHSNLTNEPIPEEIADQRPIAVMVDNESTALPHFGLTQADIIYEIMNSYKNGRITRFMAIVKDWESIEQLGSIRSARPTNFMVAAEYNAILCHDGGPFYINDYVSKDYTDNLSGGFARFSNGKATEYTEYITYDDYYNSTKGQSYKGLGARIESAGYSTTYNKHYHGDQFIFGEGHVELDGRSGLMNATEIDLSGAFEHNSSKLKYNEETGTYDYSEYGKKHQDAGNDNAQLTFENVILQCCDSVQLDDNGYLIYNLVTGNSQKEGYLIQEGQAVPIQWQKLSEDSPAIYSYEDGVHVVLNTGKTYIAIVPADRWDSISIK